VELQGSAPSFEEDSGEIGVKKELNCAPILLGLMQKSVYLSYTPICTYLAAAYLLNINMNPRNLLIINDFHEKM